MEFILGILAAVAFFIVSFSFFYIGYKSGKQQSAQPNKEQIKASEEDLRRTKKIHEDFQRLMSYDVETALDRKKADYGGEE